MKADELDCRHLLCPMPVIRTQARVARMAAGERLTVVATDPGALHDVPTWCRIHGHEWIETREEHGEFRITLRVGERQAS